MIGHLIVAALLLLLASPAIFALWPSPWRYDKRNPYRRYCKKCGQQQDQYQHALGAVEWCDMGTSHAERHRLATTQPEDATE